MLLTDRLITAIEALRKNPTSKEAAREFYRLALLADEADVEPLAEHDEFAVALAGSGLLRRGPAAGRRR
ncbi:MAG TPA: hypothetical protein PK095_02685 [Myxococcota bacterium]|nr:hypothetical protein [Myxococcota bacterium]